MTFKLTKAQHTQRDDLVEKLSALAQNIVDAVESYNDEVEKLQEPVKTLVEQYNTALADAREFASDIHSQADQDISDKSEKWQEGERGQAAISFRDAWSELTLDDLDVEFPDALVIEEPEHADALDQAPGDLDQ